MSHAFILSLSDGFEVTSDTPERIVFRDPKKGSVPYRIAPALQPIIEKLNGQGEHEDRLVELLAQEPEGVLAEFYFLLDLLDRQSLLCRTVVSGNVRLATLKRFSPQTRPRRALTATHCYALSRFTYTRRVGERIVLETPLAHGRIVLHEDRAAAFVHTLARRGRIEELAARAGFAVEETRAFLELLLMAEMLTMMSEDGVSADEDGPGPLQFWEFHDLLFHARSRHGRHFGSYGGSYRFAGRTNAPLALERRRGGDTINLFRPDLTVIEDHDPSFTTVQNNRRSFHEFGNPPIDSRSLGEFLFRVGRVTKLESDSRVIRDGHEIPLDFAFRPYPGGGALYELEFYVTIHACLGLPRGLYHYEPCQHCLERLPAAEEHLKTLLAAAAASTGAPREHLQTLITLAARYPRIAWKYSSISYATILKDVGVVYQTMYLVATAMGLAPCAVGGGDSDCFAKAAGTDYYAETAVGEFLLGSRP
ncbi:MAG: SagB family peptide dehydrogenase [Gammaproteobacteria bacterium]|nr:SagB family peptide dehydrogenase [Gammaproteobacteria bacterium]